MTPAVPPLESRPFPIAPPHFTPSPAHRRSHAPVPFNPPLGAWSGSQGGVASHLPPPRSAAAPSRDRSPFPGEGAALSRDTPHSPLSPPSPAPSPIPKTRRTTPLPPLKAAKAVPYTPSSMAAGAELSRGRSVRAAPLLRPPPPSLSGPAFSACSTNRRPCCLTNVASRPMGTHVLCAARRRDTLAAGCGQSGAVSLCER